METYHYKGFEIEIIQDDSAGNPFKENDGEPPILVRNFDRYLSTITGYGIDQDIPELTETQIRKFAADICRELNSKTLLQACKRAGTGSLSDFSDAVEAINCALSEISPSNYLDLLQAVYTWQGVIAGRFTRHGYSQGDQVEILVIATPEWLQITGANIENAEQLASTADLYASWAFGDCYGYTIDHKNGELLGSCWGFYGSDHEKSGLLENAKSEIDGYLICEQKRKNEQIKAWIRNRVPLIHRSFNLSQE